MPTDLLTKLQPFAIALALGLLIGVERERSHPPGYQPLGLRTFVLFSLLGALAARINQPLIALALTTFVGAVVIAGYLRSSRTRQKEPDIGITTEVAAVVTFGLGFLAFREPFIALIIGVVVMVVLLARTRLHKFSRRQLRPEELQATATLLLLALGILPFLPNSPIDPWQLFNPQRFGILVLIIALLQFVAYAGIRIFGATLGILLTGFMAGFVSSTAATVTLAQQVKKNLVPSLAAGAGIVLATVAMFLQVMLIIFIIAPKLLYSASVPMLISGGVMTLLAALLGKFTKVVDHYPPPKNPLALGAALRLALFLASMLVIVTIAQRFLGGVSTQIVVFIGGLFEIQGITLALATLFQQGEYSAYQATLNLGIAITASFITKYSIVWAVNRGRFVWQTSLALTTMLALFIASGLAVLWWLEAA